MVSSCVLAFLSKENALVITPILLLYNYVFKQKIKWRIFLPPLIISLIYLFLRAVTLQAFFFGPVMIAKRIPGFFAALTNYFKILLVPVNLHMEYGNKLFGITDPRVLTGLAVFFLLLFLAFRKRESNRLVTFAVLWFFIAFLPTTSIYPIHSFYMAEHWLYLPSIGFFLLLAQALVLLYEKKNYRLAAFSVLICFLSAYAYLTIKQNNYWKSEREFYQRTLQYAPESFMAHNNLGNIYLNSGNKADAVKEYLKAVHFNPRFAPAYFNLGNIYSESASQEAGIKMYLKAIEIDPQRAEVYYDLGNVYHNLGKRERSMELMQKAIKLDPVYLEAYNNLASDYAEMGNIDEALRLWNESTKIDPSFAVAHFNLSVYYFKRKQYDLALDHCDKVLKLGYQVDQRFLKELEPFRNKKSQ